MCLACWKHHYCIITPGAYTRQKERRLKMMRNRQSSSGHYEEDEAAQKVLKVSQDFFYDCVLCVVGGGETY